MGDVGMIVITDSARAKCSPHFHAPVLRGLIKAMSFRSAQAQRNLLFASGADTAGKQQFGTDLE